MTISESLMAIVGVPVPENTVNLFATKRGLIPSAEADAAVFNSPAFELATADIIMWMVTVGNVSEADYSISVTEKDTLIGMANDLYGKHQKQSAGIPTVRLRTDVW